MHTTSVFFLRRIVRCLLAAPGMLAVIVLCSAADGTAYDVRSFGAVGDGRTLDTEAINRAIEAAHRAGGGTVVLPAGTYACYSVRLRSNITLHLEAGATLLAAEPPGDGSAGYDPAEPNPAELYQDFGHSHWHNSLIWGEDLENVAVVGQGRIDGRGLSRGLTHAVRDLRPQEFLAGVTLPEAANAPRPGSITPGPFGYPSVKDSLPPRVGNKAIALKNCRRVLLRDLTIFHGGHFAVLATGTDDLTIDHLTIDTNRDGIDVDACVGVTISNCTVNSPADDAICLKSSYALGCARACENVSIVNCHVSGYREGTLLDGTRLRWRRGDEIVPGVGRIKFGTESNGGFRNITIANCTFDSCLGLALESVDGGLIEDVTITNLAMRDIGDSPFYVRLGERHRGPGGEDGHVRRVSINHVVASNVDARFGAIIAGSPGRPIEELRFSDIQIHCKGGGDPAWVGIEPPENLKEYPEPNRHGPMPVYGFFVRHARGVEFSGIRLTYARPDSRPAFALDDVKEAELRDIRAEHEPGVPVVVHRQVEDFSARDVRDVPDTAGNPSGG
ncbi:MAG: glycoside hydrolase family 28 protein [Opitutae bacterium]|nr:glycoside hydrolase family 28 protein [Opitutae bacterium]